MYCVKFTITTNMGNKMNKDEKYYDFLNALDFAVGVSECNDVVDNSADVVDTETGEDLRIFKNGKEVWRAYESKSFLQ